MRAFPQNFTARTFTTPVKVIRIHKKERGNERKQQRNKQKKITRNEGDELMYKWFLPNASEEKGNEQYKTTHQIKRSGEQTNQL